MIVAEYVCLSFFSFVLLLYTSSSRSVPVWKSAKKCAFSQILYLMKYIFSFFPVLLIEINFFYSLFLSLPLLSFDFVFRVYVELFFTSILSISSGLAWGFLGVCGELYSVPNLPDTYVCMRVCWPHFFCLWGVDVLQLACMCTINLSLFSCSICTEVFPPPTPELLEPVLLQRLHCIVAMSYFENNNNNDSLWGGFSFLGKPRKKKLTRLIVIVPT